MYRVTDQPTDRYCNYYDYAVQIHKEDTGFSVECLYTPIGKIAEEISVSFGSGSKEYTPADFKTISYLYERLWNADNVNLKVMLTGGPEKLSEVCLKVTVKADGIIISSDTEKKGFVTFLKGRLPFGKKESVEAVTFNRAGSDLRSSLGPGASKIDDALFNRDRDEALRMKSPKFRLHYDFDAEVYGFTAQNEWSLTVEERVFETRYHVKYQRINKKNTFPTPPAGWMTWYAVKFDACEKAVLENTVKQKELFKDYGANTVWVDWEWYHSGFDLEEGDPEVHYFAPDRKKYPNGLKYVSDRIKESGFIPALWVGPTNEAAVNRYMAEHDRFVYANKVSWCGRYFFDITHPDFLNDFLPRAFEKVREWGYEALKWDCLPISLEYADRFHDALTDPSVSSTQALRKAVEIARKTVGEDFYMLSCSGEWDRGVLFASDIFDAARIGGDIFSWDEFKLNFLERIMRFYVFHNHMIYCDPDNLVIRPEFNNKEQAITRASLFSLLGLPITLGDDLRSLPMDRVEIIRRALPPLDIHPMDIRTGGSCPERLVVNLQITKKFGEWNVVQVVNLKTEVQKITLDPDADLHLEEGEYLFFDYWSHRFLGKKSTVMELELPAYGSAVLSVHKKSGKKQVISTSRHISQGGFDLKDLKLDENGILHGQSLVVKGETYVITVYDPETDHVIEKTIHPEETGEITWTV